MSVDHDRRTQGGKSRRSGGGGGGHGRMNETISCGWGSPMGVFFYVGSLFSPRGGGGGGWVKRGWSTFEHI